MSRFIYSYDDAKAPQWFDPRTIDEIIQRRLKALGGTVRNGMITWRGVTQECQIADVPCGGRASFTALLEDALDLAGQDEFLCCPLDTPPDSSTPFLIHHVTNGLAGVVHAERKAWTAGKDGYTFPFDDNPHAAINAEHWAFGPKEPV